ncbi:MAG: hypothetical protein V3W19_07145 [Desulfatiglandales bacterium]
MEFKCDVCGKVCKSKAGVAVHSRFAHPVPATEPSPPTVTATETPPKIISKRIEMADLPGMGGSKITDLPKWILDDAKRNDIHLHWGTTDRHEQAVALMEKHLLMEGYTICKRYTEDNEDLKQLYGANPGGGLRRGRLILLECPNHLYERRQQQKQDRLDFREKQRIEGFKDKLTSEIQKVTQLPMKVTGDGLTHTVERG